MKTLPIENYLALREGATVLESDGFGNKVHHIPTECDWLDHDLILNGPKKH